MNPADQDLITWLSNANDDYGDDRFVELCHITAARLKSLSQANERMAGAHDRITKALTELARQKTHKELRTEGLINENESADFEGAYDMMIETARSALSDLPAPPGDSKPVAWRYEFAAKELGLLAPHETGDWVIRYSEQEPKENSFLRNITPLYAHPPADSIEKATAELPEGSRFFLSGPWDDGGYKCVMTHEDKPTVDSYEADPLSALRAAMERIEK